MNMFMRLFQMGALRALPKNLMVPAVVLAFGWYGGAKYGAPEMLMNTVDGVIAQGTEIAGGLLESAGGDSGGAEGEG